MTFPTWLAIITVLIVAVLALTGMTVVHARRLRTLTGQIDDLTRDVDEALNGVRDARQLQVRHTALQQSVVQLQKYVTEQKRTDNRPPRGSHASGVVPDTNPITGAGRHFRLGA